MKQLVALSVALAFTGGIGLTGCSQDKPAPTERWVSTENTKVKIDWDKINEAYKLAEGPEDLEKRVNEIYEGDEIISVSVVDQDASTQVVTGFFDKNTSGSIDEGEKIFTIRRDITDPANAQYQTQGHGYYAGYSSPLMSIASGMLIGSMLSNAFRPNYMPMYTTPYTTSPARYGALQSSRSAYRSANPSRFPPKASGSGKSYGSKGGSFGSRPSRRSGGGGKFGIRRRQDGDGEPGQAAAKPKRLTA